MPYLNYTDSTEFYPTPDSLIDKMIEGLDWDYISTILEPSAGKGNIIARISQKTKRNFNIDTIEFDDNLRQVLKWNFSEERKEELSKKQNNFLKEKGYTNISKRPNGTIVYWNNEERKYNPLPNEIQAEYDKIEFEKSKIPKNPIHIVGKDFLSYEPFKQYNLIIMNPPFSNGSTHLLKAISMQEQSGGSIICLLNAETIRNPYTEDRKALIKKLEEYDATIEYLEKEFSHSERQTNVEIALIKIFIPVKENESTIYERFKKEEQYKDFEDSTSTEIEVTDFISSIVNHYKIEIKSGLELIKLYKDFKPYLKSTFDADIYSYPIMRLTDRQGNNLTVNGYVKDVRRKYWKALLTNDKIMSRLTSTLQDFYQKQVESYSEYDFSEFNINTLLAEMNASIKSGIENEIIKMYDKLTEEHSYYPECTKNKHLYTGWKTNKAWKIDKKVIIPTYGIFDSYSGEPRVYEAYKTLSDIERILNFFDGDMPANVDLKDTIDEQFKKGITKNIQTKFFKVTFYKKGTCHLVFTCPKLIKRFNIYAGMNKHWLPPSYGKTTYNKMTEEEKEIIDSFQGEKDYNDTLKEASYYLNAPTQLLIEG